MSAAMGRVQLKYHDNRCYEIRKAVSYFMDLLKGLIVDESDGSTMAGWYDPVCLYDPEALGGLSIKRFCEALCAEGVHVKPGINRPLHTHPIYQTADIYNDGMPTRIVFF